eukprot:g8723.t1
MAFQIAPVERDSLSGKWLPMANSLLYLIMVAVNALGSTGSLSGQDVGQVSRMYETMITPASYAFSIWGLIYFSLAVFAIWQSISSIRDDYLIFDCIGYWFCLSCVANTLWIIVFVQAEPIGLIWLSSVLLFMIFGSLLVILLRIKAWERAFDDYPRQASPVKVAHISQQSKRYGNGEMHISSDDFNPPPTPKRGSESLRDALSFFCVDFAFSVYCGWVTVASILNVAVSLIGSGVWDNQPEWSIAILIIAAIIFIAVVVTRWNWAYGLVFTWASMAIAKGNQCGGFVATGPDTYFNDRNACNQVQETAKILGAIVAAVSLLKLVHYFYRILTSSRDKSFAGGYVTSYGS